MACVVRWDVEDVAMWLEQCLQLPYSGAFKEARIDGSKLIELSEEHLANLGVNESSHLLRLLSHIAVFRSQLGRTLLVAEVPTSGEDMPNAGELASYSETLYKDDSRQWSPIRQKRESQPRQHSAYRHRRQGGTPERSRGGTSGGVAKNGAAQEPARQRVITPRSRSAAGIERTISSPSAAGNAKDKARRSTNKSLPLAPAEGRRPQSAEAHGRSHAVPAAWTPPRLSSEATMAGQSVTLTWESPPVASPASSARQSPAGTPTWDKPPAYSPASSARSSSRQKLPSNGLLQDPAALLVPCPLFSSDEAGSSLAAVSTTLDGSDTGGGGIFSGRGSHGHGSNNTETFADAVNDEITLAARARSAERVSRQPSTSSYSVPQITPRAFTNAGSSATQDTPSTARSMSTIYSEFGRDARRGASFYTAKRHLLDRTKKVEGPEYYEKFGQFSALKRHGVGPIGRDERRTMDMLCNYGKTSPGAATYFPSPRTSVRGGSMGSASRFRNGNASAKSPGPEAYTPQHYYSSQFK